MKNMIAPEDVAFKTAFNGDILIQGQCFNQGLHKILFVQEHSLLLLIDY